MGKYSLSQLNKVPTYDVLEFWDEQRAILRPSTYKNKTVELICKRKEIRNELCKRLMDFCDEQESETDRIIDHKLIKSCLYCCDKEWYPTLRILITNYTDHFYNLKSFKKVMGNGMFQPSESYIKLVSIMSESSIDDEAYIFLYMNTCLRKRVNLEYYLDTGLGVGRDYSTLIKELSNYRMIGEINYIRESGVAFISPKNIILNSRPTAKIDIGEYNRHDQVEYRISAYYVGERFYVSELKKI